MQNPKILIHVIMAPNKSTETAQATSTAASAQSATNNREKAVNVVIDFEEDDEIRPR